jgi:hypothetical protein
MAKPPCVLAVVRSAWVVAHSGRPLHDAPRALLTVNKRCCNSITKAGNAHARRALIEGAWTYRMPARVSRKLYPNPRCRRSLLNPAESPQRSSHSILVWLGDSRSFIKSETLWIGVACALPGNPSNITMGMILKAVANFFIEVPPFSAPLRNSRLAHLIRGQVGQMHANDLPNAISPIPNVRLIVHSIKYCSFGITNSRFPLKTGCRSVCSFTD